MARIRTVKPEFWTDGKVVRLPFHVRLLFIGLWGLADDWGALEDDPERIKLTIFPADDIDVVEAIDCLEQFGLVARFLTEKGERLIFIPKFSKHQKIDKRAAKRFGGGKWKKGTISFAVRKVVAEQFGCAQGGCAIADCYYCGQPGTITWNAPQRAGAIGWITFGCLELDHFVPEFDGGSASPENIVLACRSCNRAKGAFEHGYSFLANKLSRQGPVLLEEYPDLENSTDPYLGQRAPLITRRSQPLPPIPTDSRPQEAINGLGKEGKGRDQGVESSVPNGTAQSATKLLTQEEEPILPDFLNRTKELGKPDVPKPSRPPEDIPAAPSDDDRKWVFNEGLRWLAEASRRDERKLRPVFGRWLKGLGDDAAQLRLAIQGAMDQPTLADPLAWLQKAVDARGRPSAPQRQNGFHGAAQVPFWVEKERIWDQTVSVFSKTGLWVKDLDGPKPTEPGCRCPPEILAKYGYKPIAPTKRLDA